MDFCYTGSIGGEGGMEGQYGVGGLEGHCFLFLLSFSFLSLFCLFFCVLFLYFCCEQGGKEGSGNRARVRFVKITNENREVDGDVRGCEMSPSSKFLSKTIMYVKNMINYDSSAKSELYVL